jgi:hypothetical protein
MLTMDPPRRGLPGLAVTLSVAALLLLPLDSVLATSAGAREVADPDLVTTGRPGEEATTAELRVLLDDLSLRYDELLADNTSLQQSVDDLSSERDELARSLDHLDDMYAPLEADRQLLFELRKGLPETRPEAEAQLERLRTLALSADPARLGQLVDRVEETAPAFLDWRFATFPSDTEAAQAYIESGAGAFDSSMGEFRNEVLMSVANRLDGLLTVIDRVR